MGRAALLTGMLAGSMSAVAEPRLYGVYSDMSHDSRELSGFELFLLPDGRPGSCNVSVLMQVAEGAPGYPELPGCCGCTTERPGFRSAGRGAFEGRITDGMLHGTFVDAGLELKLPRRPGVWQR